VRAVVRDVGITEAKEIPTMITPLNIVSLDQGKEPACSEDEYYRRAPEWRTLKLLGRFIAWLRRAAPAQEGNQSADLTRSGI
jgi:hypothetical protein